MSCISSCTTIPLLFFPSTYTLPCIKHNASSNSALILCNHPQNHPQPNVLSLIRSRHASGSKPGARTDPYKLALAIEGGGMRGSVAAGMCAALKYLGYQDTFDCIYGASAGAIIGAYFVSRQVPNLGCSIYSDELSQPDFIQIHRLISNQSTNIPVLHLDLLLSHLKRGPKQLSWNDFKSKYSKQPLYPLATTIAHVTTNNTTVEPTLLLPNSYEKRCLSTPFRDISNIEQLIDALRASARVPGIAGKPVRIGNTLYSDAMISEPLPYKSAFADGCTHVLLVRTRPKNANLKLGVGFYERVIASRALSEAGAPGLAKRVQNGLLRRVYKDDLEFWRNSEENECHPGFKSIVLDKNRDGENGINEVGQLERRRNVLRQAIRDGFAAAYNQVFEYANPGMGEKVAEFVFPLNEDSARTIKSNSNNINKINKTQNKQNKRIKLFNTARSS
mmetsp:Transcript_1609/g.2869  ORF Transcript_1609/g.2869 Transcript_1609/m.2869 type:complete len:447 (-) Transcript_1609:189-1529(-)